VAMASSSGQREATSKATGSMVRDTATRTSKQAPERSIQDSGCLIQLPRIVFSAKSSKEHQVCNLLRQTLSKTKQFHSASKCGVKVLSIMATFRTT
jgi:hypothetical protein